MAGEHPQMYGVYEPHLGPARTLAHWWRMCDAASFGMADGLLRVVAVLRFEGQTEYAVECARGWLRRRLHWTSGHMIETLARFLAPRILVEKSPSILYRIEYMRRAVKFSRKPAFCSLPGTQSRGCQHRYKTTAPIPVL
jgi:hypothetical protein